MMEVRRKRGTVLLVTDNISQRSHREAKKYLKKRSGIKIMYLPTATKLSAVKSIWKDAKYRFTASEYYETLEDLTYATA